MKMSEVATAKVELRDAMLKQF